MCTAAAKATVKLSRERFLRAAVLRFNGRAKLPQSVSSDSWSTGNDLLSVGCFVLGKSSLHFVKPFKKSVPLKAIKVSGRAGNLGQIGCHEFVAWCLQSALERICRVSTRDCYKNGVCAPIAGRTRLPAALGRGPVSPVAPVTGRSVPRSSSGRQELQYPTSHGLSHVPIFFLINGFHSFYLCCSFLQSLCTPLSCVN